MERESSHRCFYSLGLSDAVGISRHGANTGEIVGRELAAHFGGESLKPGGLENNTRWCTMWKKS